MEKSKKFKIIYEDNHLLVVEKGINILVQSDATNDKSLQDYLKEYLKEKYKKPGNVYLGIVHRLDRMVGGIIVFAKTSKAAGRLSKELTSHDFKKKYVAVIQGDLKNEDKLIDYLIKDEHNNITTVTTKEKGKIAILNYKVIAKKDNLSLVDIDLETGRSHQIRVQFASRGTPLYGDQKYNKKAIPNTNIALFAYLLSFTHPTTKERLEFKLDLPNYYPFNIFK